MRKAQRDRSASAAKGVKAHRTAWSLAGHERIEHYQGRLRFLQGGLEQIDMLGQEQRPGRLVMWPAEAALGIGPGRHQAALHGRLVVLGEEQHHISRRRTRGAIRKRPPGRQPRRQIEAQQRLGPSLVAFEQIQTVDEPVRPKPLDGIKRALTEGAKEHGTEAHQQETACNLKCA
jgi:hypothetical protein